MSIKTLALTFCPAFLRPVAERIERSPIGCRLASGVFWAMTGSVISRGLMLLASIAVARLLGREIFGEFGMIRSTVNMLVFFAGLSLGLTATKYIAEFRAKDPERAGRVMAVSALFAFCMGGLISIVLWFAAPWIADHALGAPRLTHVLRIGAIVLFFSAMNEAQTGALSGFEAFRRISHVNCGVGVLSFLALVVGACLGGLEGAVWALAVNTAFNWLLSHLALRKEAASFGVPFTMRHCVREWPVLVGFSMPAAIGGILVLPVLWMCDAMLVNQPDGFSQMGIYSAANQWRIAIIFVPDMIGRVVLPMLSSMTDHDSRSRFRKVFLSNALITGGTSLGIAVGVSVFAAWIMRSYGPGFEEGKWVLVCLAFSTVLASLKNVVGQAIISKGHMWLFCGLNLFWALAMVVGAVAFLRLGYGALGLALANLLAFLIHNVAQGVFAFRILDGGGKADHSASEGELSSERGSSVGQST